MRLKVILIALVVTLLLSIFTPSAFAAVYGVVTTSIKDGIVNLRSEPNSDNDSNIIAKINNGAKVEILSLGIGWHKVKRIGDGSEGYIRDRYLVLTDEPLLKDTNFVINLDDEAIVTIGEVYSVTGVSVNLRAGPGVTYDTVSSVKLETGLIMLEKGTSWSLVQVLDKSIKGYISSRYIKQGIWGKTTGNVNLRSLPGAEYRIKREIAVDTVLTVLKLGPEYSAVKIDGVTGWVSNKYLKY
jgi:uncharacterized protein YgiM (DUF1202 family)